MSYEQGYKHGFTDALREMHKTARRCPECGEVMQPKDPGPIGEFIRDVQDTYGWDRKQTWECPNGHQTKHKFVPTYNPVTLERD